MVAWGRIRTKWASQNGKLIVNSSVSLGCEPTLSSAIMYLSSHISPSPLSLSTRNLLWATENACHFSLTGGICLVFSDTAAEIDR